jgi:ABC-2 type transport system permease protein
MKNMNAEVNLYDTDSDDYAEILNENNLRNLIIIPEGFTDTLMNSGSQPELISISSMTSASALANISNDNSDGIAIIESCLKNILADSMNISDKQLSLMDDPVTISEKTVVDDKSASISMDTIISKVMAQNMILPIVVFVLIMMTSQMLISAISNEKIDKTLETLLSAPVSRTAVIGAKMLAAAVVAFINAVIYMVGFTLVFSGMTSSVDSETTVSSTSALIGEAISSEVAMHQLGLTISPVDYLLIGVQLFLTIMICLSVSIILGAMANDTKSSQNMILPILMLAMIPYIISMITDINALPTVFRIIVYAIPFTHTFSAMSNIMFGNTALFYGGIVYQAVVFALCMFFALRLFKSDKLFTSSLNLGQKSKFKKK